jgi:hypothetical protein
MRYSVELARAISMESSDLPHLPEFAFAPPPMTPPGTQMCSHRGRRRARQREREGGVKGSLIAGEHGSGGGGSGSSGGVGDSGGGGGGGSIAEGGGGKGVGSSGKPRGPSHNGVGFRRLCCRRARNQSGGRVVTPGYQIVYMDHTGCHQLNRVLTAK